MKDVALKSEQMIEDESDGGCTIQSLVPIWHKTTLTIKEAAAYSNIGINRIENLLKQPST